MPNGLNQEASGVQALIGQANDSIEQSGTTAAQLNTSVAELMMTFRGDTAVATQQVQDAIQKELGALLREMQSLNGLVMNAINSQLQADADGNRIIGQIAAQVHSQVSGNGMAPTTTLGGVNN